MIKSRGRRCVGHEWEKRDMRKDIGGKEVGGKRPVGR
jgi:hypothetical protein